MNETSKSGGLTEMPITLDKTDNTDDTDITEAGLSDSSCISIATVTSHRRQPNEFGRDRLQDFRCPEARRITCRFHRSPRCSKRYVAATTCAESDSQAETVS